MRIYKIDMDGRVPDMEEVVKRLGYGAFGRLQDPLAEETLSQRFLAYGVNGGEGVELRLYEHLSPPHLEAYLLQFCDHTSDREKIKQTCSVFQMQYDAGVREVEYAPPEFAFRSR